MGCGGSGLFFNGGDWADRFFWFSKKHFEQQSSVAPLPYK
jgi:hypothetical protein